MGMELSEFGKSVTGLEEIQAGLFNSSMVHVGLMVKGRRFEL